VNGNIGDEEVFSAHPLNGEAVRPWFEVFCWDTIHPGEPLSITVGWDVEGWQSLTVNQDLVVTPLDVKSLDEKVTRANRVTLDREGACCLSGATIELLIKVYPCEI